MEVKSALPATSFRWIRLSKLTDPVSGMCNIIRDSWWTTRRNDDGEIELAFFGRGRSPQCNKNEAISRVVCGKCTPYAEVTFVPVVYLKVWGRDYDYNLPA